MFTLPGGSTHRFCSGSRRDLLRVGSLGIAGLTLSDLLRGRAEAGTRVRAKSIITIHLGGGPSQQDTYDPKPESAVEYRGEFTAIPTSLDGVQFSEIFRLQAKIAHRMAIVRSVHRVVPEEHASSLMLTGYSNTERRATGEHPSLGSVLARVYPPTHPGIPAYVSLRGYHQDHGLGAGFLGAQYEPLVSDGPGREDLKLRVAMDRLRQRRLLLDQFDDFRRQVDTASVTAQDAFAQRATEIVSSSEAYDALDVSKEPKEVRDRYGNDHFVLARRLVERGVGAVAIEVGGWDTHSDNFAQLKRIGTALDRHLHSLITDLHQRGLLDETLVVVWGEFGRTPRVNGTAGRDHWPNVMSAMIAGGGIKVGQVVGATDSTASEPVDRPVRVREMVATMFQALGVDPSRNFIDGQNRPIPLIHDAEPIPELLG